MAFTKRLVELFYLFDCRIIVWGARRRDMGFQTSCFLYLLLSVPATSLVVSTSTLPPLRQLFPYEGKRQGDDDDDDNAFSFAKCM